MSSLFTSTLLLSRGPSSYVKSLPRYCRYYSSRRSPLVPRVSKSRFLATEASPLAEDTKKATEFVNSGAVSHTGFEEGVRISKNIGSETDNHSLTPLELYNERVHVNQLKDDEYQRQILTSMQSLFHQLQHYHPPEVAKPNSMTPNGAYNGNTFINYFASWFRSRRASTGYQPDSSEASRIPHGIYLYGDVGCGKTMLMDLFYSTIPPHLSKKRLHFHQFMQKLHKRSHELKLAYGGVHQEVDVMPILAWELSKEATVLCFDEFQVTDVADAMLLRRLIDLALREDHGLVLFTTSNRAPGELYINGIQRESFVPCIERIKYKTRVIHMKSPTDYRKIPSPVCSVYFSPRCDVAYNSKESLKQRKFHSDSWYSFFSQGHKMEYRVPIRIWGRELVVPKCSPPYVARFSFKELCGRPYAAGDYLALASQFESIIVTDIPYLSIDSRDEVKRLITFLDAVYDSHSRIAVTAAAPFDDIFVEPEDIGEDAYTLSNVGIAKRAARLAAKGGLHTSLSSSDDDPLVKTHGFDKGIADKANLFAKLDEERFAFTRALSRLKQMSTKAWVESIGVMGPDMHKRPARTFPFTSTSVPGSLLSPRAQKATRV
ncbi:hypothetical protein FOA43_003762 [Brettanomyces nanus]|uniref:AFG1-like ATPase n=1 Tax=Eeniella nana TaxID=13502 RepID=A0A875SC07_EENNA|nr:uncharacterized protein FOA43_003762 [Brettanomyces nanus]QPG76374.1 hypothetical protein FOA43_003762 [Brettanomyces nanus]